MRVVIDASIDPRLVEAFPDHHVQTLFDLGWQHLKDHVLVKQLECDVLITADRGFEHQHDPKALSFGIVVVHVTRNKITFYRPLFPQLLKAVATIRPGEVVQCLQRSCGLIADFKRVKQCVKNGYMPQVEFARAEEDFVESPVPCGWPRAASG